MEYNEVSTSHTSCLISFSFPSSEDSGPIFCDVERTTTERVRQNLVNETLLVDGTVFIGMSVRVHHYLISEDGRLDSHSNLRLGVRGQFGSLLTSRWSLSFGLCGWIWREPKDWKSLTKFDDAKPH